MQPLSYLSAIGKISCRPRALIAAAILAVIASIPYFFAQPFLQPGQYSCQLGLSTDTRSIAQVFFDMGSGFQDKNSARRSLEPKSGQAPETISFSIPSGRLHRVRIDPVDRDAKFTLSAVKIVNATGQVLMETPPQQFCNAHDIEPNLSASTGSAQHYSATQAPDRPYLDPWIEVPLPKPIDIPPRFQP